MDSMSASLLDSPIGGDSSTDEAILQKIKNFLQTIGDHMLLLLGNSFAIPMLLFIHLASPVSSLLKLNDYDKIRDGLSMPSLCQSPWWGNGASISPSVGWDSWHSYCSITSTLCSPLIHIFCQVFNTSYPASSFWVCRDMLHVDAAITSWTLDYFCPPPDCPGANNLMVWDTIGYLLWLTRSRWCSV